MTVTSKRQRPTPASPPAAAAPRPAAHDPLAGFGFTIVPHTHWDREWYLPFDVFRVRLARAVERICDVLETDPGFRSFTLDGQAVILEDVVGLRPDLEPRLRKLLAAGRLVTGPGYVLPDEFLAGPEALVRNLLHGRAVCAAFGARPMAVGYLPDTFGHVAQLPQILRGFGVETFVFWRGLGDEASRVGLAFTWRAPDGSEVLAIRQLGSYGNASQLGRWGAGGIDLADQPERFGEGAEARLERFVSTFAAEIARTGSPELLLCNGGDHEEIHERLPELVGHLGAARPAARVAIGSYEDYVARFRPTIEEGALPVVAGELVGGRDAPVLRGINSTRIGLKQAAERTERALLSAEALAALAMLDRGARPPLAELRHAWAELLRNLPHDSISGCSVDEVHRDMAPRFAAADRIASRVAAESLAALAGGGAAWTHAPAAAAAVSVVNPLGHGRRVVARIPLPLELRGTALRAVTGPDVLAVQPASRGRVALVALDLPGFGARDVRLVAAPRAGSQASDGAASRAAAAPAAPGSAVRALGTDAITNGILSVRALGDGSLEVTDERSGTTHRGLHRFEDVADRGDEYTFCPLEGDAPVGVTRPVAVRVTAAGPVLAELAIDLVLDVPRRLSADRRRRVGRVGLPVAVRVRLGDGLGRLEVSTSVDNRARDHRLRVRFPASGAADTDPVRAEGHFTVVRRPARPAWSGAGWTEPPASTSHTAGFVAAGDLAVIGRGLPEYEAIPAAGGLELALTLVRSVGWLSRDDLATRPGGAGPTLPTPEAQCQGPATLEYALLFGTAGASDNDLLRASADVRTPPAIGPVGAERESARLLAIEGDVLVTALKPADDGRGTVLRLVNAGDRPARMAVHGAVTAERVRLDETPEPGDPEASLRPNEIRTLRLAGA